MIEYKSGNILQEDAEAIVNTVNCVGIMGKGLALQFKKAYPYNFRSYAIACKNDEVQPGRMFITGTGLSVNPRLIINFPTKHHWRDDSRIEDIKSGLLSLVEVIRRYEIQSIAIPPLGCGLGGLKWEEIRPLIEEAMRPLKEVQTIIFGSKG